MNEAVQDGIGQSWVCNDLKHITPLVIIEFFRSPVIENEQVGFGELLEDPAIASDASRDGKCCKQRGNAVQDGGWRELRQPSLPSQARRMRPSDGNDPASTSAYHRWRWAYDQDQSHDEGRHSGADGR